VPEKGLKNMGQAIQQIFPPAGSTFVKIHPDKINVTSNSMCCVSWPMSSMRAGENTFVPFLGFSYQYQRNGQ
jgi:hypothetical protein